MFHHADSEDSDQIGRMSLHWAHLSFCWFYHAVAHFTLRETKTEIWSLFWSVDKSQEALNNWKCVLPAGWQETFRSAASRLSLTQKSPASRLAVEIKVSCQPATITSNNLLY